MNDTKDFYPATDTEAELVRLRKENELLGRVVILANDYETYLPYVEPIGAAGYSAQNLIAWDLRKALKAWREGVGG